jgi:alcohol dehydrogenase YqhD (iron-dependent ADH family)
MENFEFVSPTHFVFGRGAEEQVGEKLAAAGAKRVLVHFGGGSAVASGLIERVGASLDRGHRAFGARRRAPEPRDHPCARGRAPLQGD